MKQFKYIITDQVGIHARPAGLLVKEAKEFSSRITLTANDKTAEATKLMAIMSLGAKKGNEITVTVEGDDEDAASEKIRLFLENNL